MMAMRRGFEDEHRQLILFRLGKSEFQRKDRENKTRDHCSFMEGLRM
jgi:hypothetical protein